MNVWALNHYAATPAEQAPRDCDLARGSFTIQPAACTSVGACCLGSLGARHASILSGRPTASERSVGQVTMGPDVHAGFLSLNVLLTVIGWSLSELMRLQSDRSWLWQAVARPDITGTPIPSMTE